MNCKEFSNLLDDYLDGMLSEEEELRLRAHAQECTECAALLSLRRDCRKMDENIQVPDEFSAGWRRMVREESMLEKKTQKKKNWQNWLAAAAAVVFVLGGTLLTRDQFGKKGETGYDTYGAALYDNGASYDMQTSLKRSAPDAINYAVMDANVYAAEESANVKAEKIIRTVSFTLKTLEYERDLEKIQETAAEMGGRMEYLSANGEDGGTALRSAHLTLRIPSEKLDEFISGAQGIGKLTSMTQQSQDVSEAYYDTQARLETQLQKMERLQILMKDAENIADLIEIESAIADTQYWIDHYTGQKNHYDDQVDYSTVSVSLQEIRVAEEEEISLWQRMISGLRDSLAGGVAFLGDLMVFLMAAAPWLMITGIAIFVVKKIGKRRKEK